MRHRTRPSRLLAALAALAVTGGGLVAATLPGATPAAAAVTSARNLPANGQVRVFVGQDSDTISAYRRDTASAGTPAPGGVTLYTNIVLGGSPAPLAGLDGPVDYGSGPQDVPRTLSENPGAALAVGLYLSDSSNGCGNQPLRAIINRPDADVQSGNPTLAQQYRATVDQMVTKLKNTNRQVFLRIGYEFDGPWNCYNADYYVQAFRYIKGRIDALGASNVATVWQSAAWPLNTNTDHPEYHYIVTDPDHLSPWYPGDAYVDWVGMSAFYGSTYKTPQWSCSNVDVTPRTLQDRVLSFARARNKPVMIAESAPQGFQTGAKTGSCILSKNPQPTTGDAIWNTWYADYFDYVEANRDVIRAIAYINTNWDTQATWACNGAPAGQPGCASGYWGDSRVQADPTVLSRWTARLKSSVYVNGTGTSTGGGSTPTPTASPTPTRSPTSSPTPTPTPTTAPPTGATRNPYATVEGESYDATSGGAVVSTANASGGQAAGRLGNGDWVRYDRLAFGSSAPTGVVLHYSSGISTSSSFTVEFRDGSATGTLLGAAGVRGTGAWTTYTDLQYNLSGASSGTRSIAVVVRANDSQDKLNIDTLRFTGPGASARVAGARGTGVQVVPAAASRPAAVSPTSTSRALFIGQGNTNAYTDFAGVTGSNPAGGSVYYGVKAGTWQGATGGSSHKAFADYLANAGKSMEVGISWKDDPPNWNGDNSTKLAASRAATRDIAAGRYDGQFATLESYIRAHPSSTFFLRLDYEVSSAFHCTNGTDCSSYKAAYRHLVQVIDANTGGGANVRYVHHSVRGEFDKLYPGDDVVDYVGVSVFNQDLCHPYFENGTAYWNGDGDRTKRTCSGYQDVIVNGNRNAQRYEYPVDQNILRMMWWAQQHRKPMIVAESGVQRMAQAEDSNGVQAQSDVASYLNRLQTLLTYRGPLPNGVIDGQQTSFVGTYDLSNVITALVYINVDWRYGFDGKVAANQPYGFASTADWYVNSLLSANPGARTPVCTLLSGASFSTRCS